MQTKIIQQTTVAALYAIAVNSQASPSREPLLDAGDIQDVFPSAILAPDVATSLATAADSIIASVTAAPQFTSFLSVVATGIPITAQIEIQNDPTDFVLDILSGSPLPSWATALPPSVGQYLESVAQDVNSIVTSDFGALYTSVSSEVAALETGVASTGGYSYPTGGYSSGNSTVPRPTGSAVAPGSTPAAFDSSAFSLRAGSIITGAVTIAIEGIFTSSSSTSQPVLSTDRPLPSVAGFPINQYLTATKTSTSPLSIPFAMAPASTYYGLPISLFLALIFWLLTVLPSVQHIITSVSIASNKNVRNLNAEADTKNARIQELEHLARQERRQMRANADEISQLKKQLYDANAMVHYQVWMRTLAEKKLEQEIVAKQEIQLRNAQREYDQSLEAARRSLQQSNVRSVREMQKEIDRRQKIHNDVQEEWGRCNDLNCTSRRRLDSAEGVETTLKGQLHNLEQVIVKINSEQAAASARENNLHIGIAANRTMCQGHIDDAYERKRNNTHLGARDRKITKLKARLTNIRHTVNVKDFKLANADKQNEVLKAASSVLQAAQAELVSTKVIKQWINDYQDEKLTSKRYHREFSKCLNKLERCEERVENLQSNCETIMKESMKYMNDNINLLNALRTETETCKALQKQVKCLAEHVSADREEIMNQERNIRNLSETMEEEIAELKPLHVHPLSPYDNTTAVECMDTSADVPKDMSAANQNLILIPNPSHTTLATVAPIQDLTGRDIETEVQASYIETADMNDRGAIQMSVTPAYALELHSSTDRPIGGAEEAVCRILNADEPAIEHGRPKRLDNLSEPLRHGHFGENDNDSDDEDVNWEDALPTPCNRGGEERSKGRKRELG
ncbi:MAG: hypothetical protein Q9216_003931 [Gyalolechia sp. 2 TL-2023]